MATRLEITNSDYYGVIAGQQMQRIVVSGTKAEVMAKLATVTVNDWLYVGNGAGSVILLVARADSSFWSTLMGTV